MQSVKKRTLALVTEIDPAEMAVRCFEAYARIKRPKDDAVASLGTLDNDEREAWFRVALAASKYITERIDAGKQPS